MILKRHHNQAETFTFSESGNTNLNSVAMALAGYTDEKNALWQKTCNSLRPQLTHPYLRSMFAFLVGERDSYKDVLVRSVQHNVTVNKIMLSKPDVSGFFYFLA